MMGSRTFKSVLAGSVCALALNTAAMAQEARTFDVPAGDLGSALDLYIKQSGEQLIYRVADVRGMRTSGVRGALSPDDALQQLLAGTNLKMQRDPSGLIAVASLADPQSGSAAGDGADAGTVQALIVTAQKREENIQDVPIAMSAFSQEDLTRSQVTGGPDLMTQVPNMTFTKTNFTSYSIQIRGIGTQAISATVDPAVAVAFNNTPFLRAHFFEQEFYDMERVEVLRGPQGTLYGRNATAGVVNLISAKPKFRFEAKASADISNYSSHRVEGMLNLPLVEDKAALRIAGAWTKRDGFVTNINTGKPTDGRDLWSTRVTLRVDPTDKLRTNFVWEHFEEDDDRLRSGKQTCKRAVAPTEVMGIPVGIGGEQNGVLADARYLDQGCDPVSVYSPEAFQVPDGMTLPFYLPMGQIGGNVLGNAQFDIYASATQSRDLRAMESQVDPKYLASSDTVELNLDYDVTQHLTFSSQTGFGRDFIFSTEDYNRFNTKPGAFTAGQGFTQRGQLTPSPVGLVFGPGSGDLFGTPCDLTSEFRDTCYVPQIFCDPQIGCSDKLVLMDLATARSRQFSQEIRLASSFDGPFNFSLGANYLRYKTREDYYVFINSVTDAMLNGGGSFDLTPWVAGVSDNHECLPRGFDYLDPRFHISPQQSVCGYIDPNPVTDLNGEGHNYFRSQNPYKLQSYAIFGEAYYDITPNLKLTAGLRWTVDRKHFDSIPSQIMVASYGYPILAVIKQEWREPTGRLVLTWKPDLAFTDETMIYGSYAHGYKAGGANPPGAMLLTNRGGDITFPVHPSTFDPEFVNAYELGTKNTLLEGKLVLNLTGFYYDYTGYQISEIVDRSAINRNFDAKVWGVELESDWRPMENLRLGLKIGYEDTRVNKAQSVVDLMDRTAGHPGWMVVKPFPTQASNCVMPNYVVAALLQVDSANNTVENACTLSYLSGVDPITGVKYGEPAPYGVVVPAGYPGFDPLAGMPDDPYTGQNTYNGVDYGPAPNNGAGFAKDLSGHALPNAPHWTATLTADYTLPLPNEWLLTLHGDFYQQSEAWARIINMPGYDKLKAYNNVNLAAIFSNEGRGWTVMAYIKNVFDKDNITGTFLNSDDTGLTTNVFLNEPRLYGLRVTKAWSESPWWGSNGPAAAFPLRIELEGYHGELGGGHATLMPAMASLFSNNLRLPTAPQTDVAALNGGGIKLTYQPSGAPWNFSAAVRYGRAGGGTEVSKQENLPQACFFNGKYCWNPSDLPPTINGTKYGWHNYFNVLTKGEESHTFADFLVGRDVGLGGFSGAGAKMSVSAGLAYGRFKSMSDAALHGQPNVYIPPSRFTYNETGFHLYYTHTEFFNHHLRADREFEGAGPEVNWDAAFKLAGKGQNAGRIDLDVGLGGTVLFGKQKAKVDGSLDGYYSKSGPAPWHYVATTLYNTPIRERRETHATVPGVRANLGLSYSTGGLKLSSGYRWERYYNAIDGGIEEREQYDRTFEGPYMKIAVGFGG